MSEPAITVTELTKVVHGRPLVHDISFTVGTGRAMGFIGPNGAGKSTTLACMLGLARPSQGIARFHGFEYRELPQPTRVVGACLSPTAAAPGASGKAHLERYRILMGASRDAIDRSIELTNISSYVNKKVGTWSTGMKQRLMLATALLGNPSILILDEPTNGLDPDGILWLKTFTREFVASGNTALISSHVLGELDEVFHDVTVLESGGVVATGPIEELKQRFQATTLLEIYRHATTQERR